MIKRFNRRMLFSVLSKILISAQFAISGFAQQTVQRILVQDSTLDNLIDPPGYKTSPLGTLGRVDKIGHGRQGMILIPGLGFSGSIFKGFMSAHEADYTMYAVTLAGFGGTQAPPCPPESTSFGEQTWTNAAVVAIEKLIEDEKIEQPVIIGHWLGGTQVALRLAFRHPDKIKAVMIPSGSACFVATDTTRMKPHPPADYRLKVTDQYMAPKWFKTVTRETWDDNNFLPGDYAVNPILGLRLWREAASPLLHVWVRYLNEFNSQDISLQLDSLTVPTLLLLPGLEDLFYQPGANYMFAYTHTSWVPAAGNHKSITSVTIPNSRICMWLDQPEKFNEEVNKFLAGVK